MVKQMHDITQLKQTKNIYQINKNVNRNLSTTQQFQFNIFTNIIMKLTEKISTLKNNERFACLTHPLFQKPTRKTFITALE